MKKCVMILFLILFFLSICFGVKHSKGNPVEEEINPREDFLQKNSIPEIPVQDEQERRAEILAQDEDGLQEDQTDEIAESVCGIEQYYGTYQIIEFWQNISYRALRFDRLREQEADMLLGRIIEIKEDLLVSWDCFIGLGTSTGRHAFYGNYMVEKFSVEAPQYEWEALDPDTQWYEDIKYPFYNDYGGPCEEYYEAIEGKIRIQIPDAEGYYQDYFVTENGIIMYSAMHHQYFYLARVDMESAETVNEKELTEEEKQRILQDNYGTYVIVKFLPTKFYPALDSGGDIRLPQGEADMMIGREVVIGEDLFITYDNLRLPNSVFMGRAMDELYLETIEITNPDYQIQEKYRDDIFGLRDEMLSEEMVQEKYIEISVYPGFGSMDRILPQLYLLNDGKIIMYAMGEYFLIEKEG
ncbi:MAG: hypothetical protein HDQ98_00520 [Lachnospiraceae bacterium]|nr:hypothetical protein [Lachnospiraceae bacterium]